MPCYNLNPVISLAFDILQMFWGSSNFQTLMGSVYKTRERIHRNMMICDY